MSPKKKGGRAPATLVVKCETWDEFAALYANDISLGGMYIETGDGPAILSTVAIKLQLPEGHEIQIKAEVVHHKSAEEAELEGRAEGIGVGFRDVDPMMKKQLWHLVEYCKWEAGSPGARSYAAALMEFAQTQAVGTDVDAWRSMAPPAYEPEEPEDADRPDTEPASADAREESSPPQKGEGVSAGPPREEAAAVSNPITAPPAASVRPRHSVSPDVVPVSSRPPRSTPSAQPPGAAGEADAKARASRAGEAARMLAASLKSKGGMGRPSVRVSKSPSSIGREKVSQAFKDIAYKRYDMAIRTLEEVVTQDPENKKAKMWLNTARARRSLQQGKRRDADRFYQAVLEAEATNHEALKFVRNFERDEKVKNVPFARYFIKKP